MGIITLTDHQLEGFGEQELQHRSKLFDPVTRELHPEMVDDAADNLEHYQQFWKKKSGQYDLNGNARSPDSMYYVDDNWRVLPTSGNFLEPDASGHKQFKFWSLEPWDGYDIERYGEGVKVKKDGEDDILVVHPNHLPIFWSSQELEDHIKITIEAYVQKLDRLYAALRDARLPEELVDRVQLNIELARDEPKTHKILPLLYDMSKLDVARDLFDSDKLDFDMINMCLHLVEDGKKDVYGTPFQFDDVLDADTRVRFEFEKEDGEPYTVRDALKQLIYDGFYIFKPEEFPHFDATSDPNDIIGEMWKHIEIPSNDFLAKAFREDKRELVMDGEKFDRAVIKIDINNVEVEIKVDVYDFSPFASANDLMKHHPTVEVKTDDDILITEVLHPTPEEIASGIPPNIVYYDDEGERKVVNIAGVGNIKEYLDHLLALITKKDYGPQFDDAIETLERNEGKKLPKNGDVPTATVYADDEIPNKVLDQDGVPIVLTDFEPAEGLEYVPIDVYLKYLEFFYHHDYAEEYQIAQGTLADIADLEKDVPNATIAGRLVVEVKRYPKEPKWVVDQDGTPITVEPLEGFIPNYEEYEPGKQVITIPSYNIYLVKLFEKYKRDELQDTITAAAKAISRITGVITLHEQDLFSVLFTARESAIEFEYDEDVERAVDIVMSLHDRLATEVRYTGVADYEQTARYDRGPNKGKPTTRAKERNGGLAIARHFFASDRHDQYWKKLYPGQDPIPVANAIPKTEQDAIQAEFAGNRGTAPERLDLIHVQDLQDRGAIKYLFTDPDQRAKHEVRGWFVDVERDQALVDKVKEDITAIVSEEWLNYLMYIGKPNSDRRAEAVITAIKDLDPRFEAYRYDVAEQLIPIMEELIAANDKYTTDDVLLAKLKVYFGDLKSKRAALKVKRDELIASEKLKYETVPAPVTVEDDPSDGTATISTTLGEIHKTGQPVPSTELVINLKDELTAEMFAKVEGEEGLESVKLWHSDITSTSKFKDGILNLPLGSTVEELKGEHVQYIIRFHNKETLLINYGFSHDNTPAPEPVPEPEPEPDPATPDPDTSDDE